MTSEEQPGRTLHIPPKYNLRGRRQLWFLETGNDTVDNFGNGAVAALLTVGPIALLASVVSPL